MMEKNFSKPPIYLAIVWLAVKIAIHKLYPEWDSFMFGACINVLFVFGLILLNLRKNAGSGSFLSQFKRILKPVAFYILLTGIGIFVFYHFVNSDYIQNKREQSLVGMEEAIEKDGGWEAFKEKNPSIKQKRLADFIKFKKENPPAFLTAQSQALLSILVLLLMAIFWSIIFLLVSTKVLEQQATTTPLNSQKDDQQSEDNPGH